MKQPIGHLRAKPVLNHLFSGSTGGMITSARQLRHTYRSWLDDTGAPVGVQQKLMRHAQVSTTMNIYGNALMGAKREVNSKVVRMALRSA
jgi:integrase